MWVHPIRQITAKPCQFAYIGANGAMWDREMVVIDLETNAPIKHQHTHHLTQELVYGEGEEK